MRATLALLSLLAAPLLAKDPPDARLREKIAGLFLEQAKWCREKGLKSEAARAIEEAREAGAPAAGLDALRAEVEALEADAEPPSEAVARRERVFKEAAGHYGKLAALDHDAKESARFDGYFLKSIELDPSKPNLAKLAARVKQNAGNKAQAESTGRMLVKLRALDAEGAAKGRYDALEADLAKADLALIQGDHPMVGWISLPKGHSAKGEWPILVAVEGAGCNFVGAARGFAQARASRNFIVLTPCSLSNTNELDPGKYPFYSASRLEEGGRDRIRFDLDGLRALLETVRARYRGGARIGITGFSGGGNLCYAMIGLHSDELLFAAPACANFAGMGFADAKPAADPALPIHILTGEKDPHRHLTHGKTPPGIEEQTDMAVAALGKLGFTSVRRTMLPGVGHSSCAQQVFAFADETAKK